MKNAIIIGAILLATWYFFFKKKAVSSPGAQAINPTPTPTAKEVIQKVNDFLIAPERSLVDPAKANYENIAALTEQPSRVSPEPSLAPYLPQDAQVRWIKGAYGPFGRELTPAEKAYIRARFIPIAKVITSPTAAQYWIDTLNSDQYSVYIFDTIAEIEGFVAQAQQITDNADWQRLMTNKNMYFENGVRDMTKTPVVPEILRNYKPFIKPGTKQPYWLDEQ